MQAINFDRQGRRMIVTVAVSLTLVLLLAVWSWAMERREAAEQLPESVKSVSEPQLSHWMMAGMANEDYAADPVVDPADKPQDLPHSDFAGPDPMIEDTYLRDDIPLEYELQAKLYAAAKEAGVDYTLTLAVVEEESRFQNLIGDGGDSIGYFQIQKKWHQPRMERLGVTDLSDPESNFRVGCDFLAELLEGNQMEDALSLYNSGHPGETAYSRRVIKRMEQWN